MLIDLEFLGLQVNMSNRTEEYYTSLTATTIDSDFKINFISSSNFASVTFDWDTVFTDCSITDSHTDYNYNNDNPNCPIFKQKILIVEKMIKEELTKDDILDQYPELVI